MTTREASAEATLDKASLRAVVARVRADFPGAYWRDLVLGLPRSY